MKKIIIFEGMASSGKTTLVKMLQEGIQDSAVITEGETLMPIFEEKDPRVAAAHLMGVLQEARDVDSGTVIIDRLHFTQAFRTGSSLRAFRSIEDGLLGAGQPFLVLLTVRDEAILERIKETDEHRAGAWVKKKQGTYEERAEYYKAQQYVLRQCADESRLPVLVVDTTDKNWGACLSRIADFVGMRGHS